MKQGEPATEIDPKKVKSDFSATNVYCTKKL
jgi:hypothetical protein